MKTKIIYSPKCLEYGDDFHPENAERIGGAVAVLKKRDYEFITPFPASKNEILAAHSTGYIQAVKNGIARDADTPAYADIYEHAQLSAGAAILAAQTNNFSLMRPPGHHIGKNGAALGAATRGFCYFNNIAIAVKKLNKKTVIIDIDGHHGNGTQEIFLNDKKVTYISIHRNNVFPQTGSITCANCFNYPLPADCGAKIYFQTLTQALNDAQVKINKAEILAIDAGFDTHAGDLVSLGLETEDFFTLGKQIAALQKPTFFVAEGGYRGQLLGEDINAFLQGFET
jgi:acetoin utilization deacetylase AcuC-like enzyme